MADLLIVMCSALGERVPPLVTHISEGFVSGTAADTQHRPLKRTYAMLGKYFTFVPLALGT